MRHFFRTSSPGLYENCNFRFAKRPYWRSFDLRLPIKFDLLDEKCFFVFVDGNKTSEIWRRKEHLLLRIRKACMPR